MENQIFYTVNVLLHCNFATMLAVKNHNKFSSL